MTDDEIKALIALSERATRGPWRWAKVGGVYSTLWADRGMRPIVLNADAKIIDKRECPECGSQSDMPVMRTRNEHDLLEELTPEHPDAALIAACGEALPALAAEVLRLREALRSVKIDHNSGCFYVQAATENDEAALCDCGAFAQRKALSEALEPRQ